MGGRRGGRGGRWRGCDSLWRPFFLAGSGERVVLEESSCIERLVEFWSLSGENLLWVSILNKAQFKI